MANLQEILQSAQGGKAAENLAERFGITTEQASAAIQAFAPALSAGLQQALQNPGSIPGIIGQLTAGIHQASFQSPDSAHSEGAIAGGSTVLSQAFGDPHITGQIAQQAARVTGLRPDLLMQMAPVIASMLAGGLMSSLKSQGFGNILSQLTSGITAPAGGNAGAAGGLAGLFSSVMSMFGALTGQAAGAAANPQAALDALKRTLQPGSQVDPQHQAAVADILKR